MRSVSTELISSMNDRLNLKFASAIPREGPGPTRIPVSRTGAPPGTLSAELSTICLQAEYTAVGRNPKAPALAGGVFTV